MPAASIAKTVKVCLPFLTLTFFGDVHELVARVRGASPRNEGLAAALPSRLHWKLELASLDWNSKLAFLLFVFFAGALVIVVSGGVVSPAGGAGICAAGTVYGNAAEHGDVWPAPSVAVARKFVVAAAGTVTAIPGDPNTAALSWPSAVPEQSELE